jgi:tRNA (guanine-N7-)-methyltransferase
LELEIGCGKGNFIIKKALDNPNTNYIGVERDSTIVLKILKKITQLAAKLDNLLIININANELNN